MRVFISAFLLLLSFSTFAHARLGENEATLSERYGAPVLKLNRGWCVEERFSANGFSIRVALMDGVSVSELLQSGMALMTNTQISDLLWANSEGLGWDEVPKEQRPPSARFAKNMWRRGDGGIALQQDRSFEVKSCKAITAEQDAIKKPAAPSTSGF
jgi:hypothetical protein